MRKHVLVILDSVHITHGVRKLAIKYAKTWPAHLTGAGVIDVTTAVAAEIMPIGAIHLKATIDRQRTNSILKLTKKKLKAFSQECSKEGLDCQIVLREGDHTTQVEELAQENDLIILDQRNDFHFFKDHITYQGVKDIIRGSSRPVIVCPPTVQDGQTVLVAYDGSQPCIRTLHLFLLMGFLVDLPIRILTIAPNKETAEAIGHKAKVLCERYNRIVQLTPIVSSQKPEKIIQSFAKKDKAEIIVMGAFGNKGIKEFFFGSCTEHLLKKSKTPLFISR
jgi:nucleotide-binding universal stress UspA family protein